MARRSAAIKQPEPSNEDDAARSAGSARKLRRLQHDFDIASKSGVGAKGALAAFDDEYDRLAMPGGLGARLRGVATNDRGSIDIAPPISTCVRTSFAVGKSS
jgi:hypothetical protein